MLRVALEGLVHRKLRLVATALAVVIGVAFMSGTLVLTDTMNRTFDSLFATVYKGTDVVVRAQGQFDVTQGSGTQRGRIKASLLSSVSKVPGVAVAEGSVLGYTRLIGSDGKALGNPAYGAPTLGGSWSANPAMNPFTIVAGRPPAAPDEIAIDAKSARDGHLQIGDVTTVLAQAPPQEMHISGIVRFGNTDSPGGASVVLFTLPVAQRLVAQPGMYDAISVVAEKGSTQSELASRISRVLPAGTEAVTGASVISETQSDMHKAMSFFGTFMMIFAVISLVVGGFIIFNTFSITVAQRTRDNALLRALGATRGQVTGAVLIEALAVGLVASVSGLGLGVAVAAGLEGLLSVIGLAVPAGGITFLARTVLVGLLAGAGITLAAAYAPARRAGRVPPIAAMRDADAGTTSYSPKRRATVGTALTACGVAALFTGLFAGTPNASAVVGVGSTLVFAGITVLGRTISVRASRLIGWPLARAFGITGQLARQNAARNPKRTAASASALMIGVALVAFMTIFASSTQASINATVDKAFAGDYIIDSGGGVMGGLDPSLVQRLKALPEVRAATGVSTGYVKVAGKVDTVLGVDPRAAFALFDIHPLQGNAADLGAQTIAVYKDIATSNHWHLGSRVPVVFKDTGLQHLRVAMIYGEHQPAGNYVLGAATYRANFTNTYESQVFIQKAPSVGSAQALHAVERVASGYPGTTVLDRAGYKAEQMKPVNQLLSLVYALLALAVGIALLGIADTLALSIFERTREIGVMRAIGMTRRQLRSSVRAEAVIIALQGTVLGVAIGVFFGWASVRAAASQGLTEFSFPLVRLAVIVTLAGLAGMAAAAMPARRAAKLEVLHSVVSE